MFDYVRFPTDGDVAGASSPGKRAEPKWQTIAAVRPVRDRAPEAARRARLCCPVRTVGHARPRDRPATARSSRSISTRSTRWCIPPTSAAASTTSTTPSAEPGRTVSFALLDFRQKLEGRTAEIVPWLQDFSLGRTYTLADVAAADPRRHAARGPPASCSGMPTGSTRPRRRSPGSPPLNPHFVHRISEFLWIFV